MQRARYQLTWGSLIAIEPTDDEIVRHAPALRAAYNDPHNAPLLGHTEAMTEADVIDSYRALIADGGHSFMVFSAGALVADGDLRHIAGGSAELAFLVTEPANQGRGLGTQLATLLHAFAFAELGLARVYASVMPDNAASLRVFAKLGHVIDHSPAARAYADEPSDLVSVVDRARFTQAAGAALAAIEITPRPGW